MPRLDGIDVSEHQGVIDWRKVPAMPFVAARAVDGAGRVDDMWVKNATGMESGRREGKWRGCCAYVFCGKRTPVQHADALRAAFLAAGLGSSVPPGWAVMLDLEPDPGAGIGPLPFAHIQATLDALTTLGTSPLLYVGYGYRTSDGRRPYADSGAPIWLPWYRNGSPTAPARCVVWQWGGGTNSVHPTWQGALVPGITPGRHVDANQIEQPDAFWRCFRPTGTPPVLEQIPPPTPEDDDMARIPPYLLRSEDPTRPAVFLSSPETATVRWVVSGNELAQLRAIGLGTNTIDDTGYDRLCVQCGIPEADRRRAA